MVRHSLTRRSNMKKSKITLYSYPIDGEPLCSVNMKSDGNSNAQNLFDFVNWGNVWGEYCDRLIDQIAASSAGGGKIVTGSTETHVYKIENSIFSGEDQMDESSKFALAIDDLQQFLSLFGECKMTPSNNTIYIKFQ